MDIKNILSPTLTACHIKNSDTKKLALQAICKLASEADESIRYTDMLDALQRREKLGSTAIGNGVAIPHARVPELSSPRCVLTTLNTPIDFDCIEDENNDVDIIFTLFVPEDAPQAHLELLSTIANHLKNKHYLDALRQATNNEELYNAAIVD